MLRHLYDLLGSFPLTSAAVHDVPYPLLNSGLLISSQESQSPFPRSYALLKHP